MGNADKRILNARRTLHGPRDALDNIVGYQLEDGTQCYVIDEQANYRFIVNSSLPVDGRFVVSPNGGSGRWVREGGGPVGFALLETGTYECPGGEPVTVTYGEQILPLVHFQEKDGVVTYAGSVARLAMLSATVQSAFDRGSAEAYIMNCADGMLLSQATLQAAGSVALCTIVMLMPGDQVALRVRSLEKSTGRGSLRVVLL